MKRLRAVVRRAVLTARDRRAGAGFDLVENRLQRIGKRDVLLVTHVSPKHFEVSAFVEYYRRLGVGHFLMSMTGGSPEFRTWAATQPDISLWEQRAGSSATDPMGWRNDLMRRHGDGHWCLLVDPDQYLVYPCCESRRLPALTRFLDDDARACMHTLAIHAYPGPRNEGDHSTPDGSEPFRRFAYFDRDGYVQTGGRPDRLRIIGGPKLRNDFSRHPGDAPALNQITLVRWNSRFHFRTSLRDTVPASLALAHTPGEVSTSGVLFDFSLAPDAGGAAHDGVSVPAPGGAFVEGTSVRYSGSEQLVALGLMSPGRWF